MCFFKKKKTVSEKQLTEKQLIVEDINLIKLNMQKISVLLVYAEEFEDIGDRLKKIQENLKYANPVADQRVQGLDRKITEQLNKVQEFLDLCHTKQNYEGWQDKIRGLEILIAERNANII